MDSIEGECNRGPKRAMLSMLDDRARVFVTCGRGGGGTFFIMWERGSGVRSSVLGVPSGGDEK